MMFVRQKIPHKPWRGQAGDCHRAALASLFHLSIDDVPHFAEGAPPPHVFHQRVSDWLATMNLASVTWPLSGELTTVLNVIEACAPGVFWMLSGRARGGFNHTVIGRNNRVVHDPSRDSCGLAQPASDGFWWVTFLVVKEPDRPCYGPHAVGVQIHRISLWRALWEYFRPGLAL